MVDVVERVVVVVDVVRGAAVEGRLTVMRWSGTRAVLGMKYDSIESMLLYLLYRLDERGSWRESGRSEVESALAERRPRL